MRPAGPIVEGFLRAARADDAMKWVARLSELDRYQASRGIDDAAAFVAEQAYALGLEDVRIDHFPADGAVRWWSFRAPLSWTPTTGRMEIHGDASVLTFDHAERPFCLATYSAATPRGGLVTRLVDAAHSDGDVAGATVVIGADVFVCDDWMSRLASGGAAGFITDHPSVCAGGAEYRGRIELAPRSPVFGFSVTPSEIETIRARAARGGHAHVLIEIERGAAMPVVSGLLRGDEPGAHVWLTAHLCHPRPGANDNASGVAALLGVAAACADSWRQRSHESSTLRFSWGPEFLGIVATLHAEAMTAGRIERPSSVINLDMVGEDQALCGGPFVVERPPDSRSSLMAPISEHIVAEVFRQTAAWPGTWRAVPFSGFSDNAVFASPSTACPAVQFGHVPDVFNHSSGDAVDKVSPTELRAIAAGASLAWAVAGHPSLPSAALEEIVSEWCTAELTAVRGAAVGQSPASADWHRALLQYVAARNADMISLLRFGSSAGPSPSEGAARAAGPRVRSRFQGPFNVRAMLEDANDTTRRSVRQLLANDKRNGALLVNFAIRADGRRTAREIVDETSFALRRPIDEGISRPLFDALIESAWVQQEPWESHDRHR